MSIYVCLLLYSSFYSNCLFFYQFYTVNKKLDLELTMPLGWRFVDGKEEKRTLSSALILAPGISHLFAHLSFFPSACPPTGD